MAVAVGYSQPFTIPVNNIILKGYIVEPEDTAYASTVVIILHGWLRDGYNGAKINLPYAKKLAVNGFTSITLSMRGWPETGGADDCGHQQSIDIVRAIDWIKNRSTLKVKNIGLVGFSQGGQVALLTAAKSRQLDFVVAYYPVTDINAWQQSSNIKGITDDYIPYTCAQAPGNDMKSPLNHAASINSPVLFIHGDMDFRVPAQQSHAMIRKMEQANRDSELLIIESADHGNFTAQQSKLAFDRTLDFINRYSN